MMKNTSLVITFLLVPMLLFALGKRPEKNTEAKTMIQTDTELNLPSAANRLGFDLFARLTSQRPGENIFLSPYSIHSALCMAYSGARGKTAQAMAGVMHLGSWQLPRLMDECRGLKKELASEDTLISLDIANSLWSRKGLALKTDFRNAVKKYFDGQAQELDFNSPEAKGIINGWVKEKTRGKIEKIIERIPPDAALYLINAVYFKGKWQTQFDKQLTREKEFFLPGGKPQRMPFMRQDGEYQYLRGESFQAARLPYGAGRFAMYLFLPDKRDGLEALLKQATPENWTGWLSGFHKTKGHIELPRFKAEYFQDLVPALEALGMGPAFRASADFSGLSDEGLSISEVLHKTVVEVNEEGTVAAAVTSIGVRVTSIAPVQKPFEMVVDHPFLMAIVDQDTEAVLFLGAIYEPR